MKFGVVAQFGGQWKVPRCEIRGDGEAGGDQRCPHVKLEVA